MYSSPCAVNDERSYREKIGFEWLFDILVIVLLDYSSRVKIYDAFRAEDRDLC